jgi:hypothetical protein
MRKALSVTFLVALAALATPATAEACSCMAPGPPCQQVWESPLVFAGTVIEVDQPPGAFAPRRVRFKIIEAFRGTEQGEIDIHLRGGGGGSCDPAFRMGESWLVYGHNRWEGGPGWTASSCSRTRLLDAADEDLAFLRTPDAQKPPSHIAGRVVRQIRESQAPGGESVPVEGVPVTVTTGTTRVEVRTERDGRYHVPADPGRRYQVDFAPRFEGFVIRRPTEHVLLRHSRACAEVSAGAVYDGRVSGQVVDQHGAPVPFLPITLVSSPPVGQQHQFTDESGRFSFVEVYPLPHDVVPSTSLWRGARALPPLTPSPVDVPPAGRVDTGRLRIPAQPKMTLVEIVIEDSTGQPAGGASLMFKLAGTYESIQDPPRADEAGTFRVSVAAGQRYEVQAWYTRTTPDGPRHETAKAVIEATGMKPIRLTLAPNR